MTVTTVASAAPPPEHARWCSGGCDRWLGSGAPTCLPAPCVCRKTRADRPQWAKDQCWWPHKLTGRPTAKCPCWGSKRDGKPGHCCAHHSANPFYAPPVPLRGLDDLDVAPLVVWVPEHVPKDLDELWFDGEIEFPEYERRYQPEELTCPCVLPWDGKGAKWHCCDCHQSFASYGVGEVHRRRWTEPCRDPADIVDIDTGRPLMYQGADGVWGALYPTTQ